MATPRTFRRFPATARQRGASIVETMVGILIGLIVVAVIYNTLIVAEGFRRSTLGVADAQVTGQLSQFIVGRELSNAGNGVMSGDGIAALALCDEWRLRPMPALITDGGAATTSDTVTIFYSNSPKIVHPVRVEDPAMAAAADPITVASPNGFRVNDWFVATDRAANCTLGQVTAITQPDNSVYPPAAAGGFVKLAFASKAGAAASYPVGPSRVVNLGQNMTRSLYSIDAAKSQLNTTDDNPGLLVAATPVPLAQNVVLLKAQYGVDTSNPPDAIPDCWTPADNSDTCGVGLDFSAAVFQTVPAPANMAARIAAIKAIRVAVVVRSEDVAKDDPANQTLWGRSAVGAPDVWLFNCAADDATCQGRLRINPMLQDGVRYRTYEATIPLRNSIWNEP
jgi:type IV pilus assembly protein PilW